MYDETDAVVLLLGDPDRSDIDTSWLDDATELRAVDDEKSAIDSLPDADVVVLDQRAFDAETAALISAIRERDAALPVVVITGNGSDSDPAPDPDLLKLDVETYLRAPVDGWTFKATVERVVWRAAVDRAIESYRSLAERRRAIEAETDEGELVSNTRYAAVERELEERRERIDRLLTRPEATDASIPTDADNADRDGPDDASSHRSGRTARPRVKDRPLYRRRSRTFYAMWLVAALTYGLGDVVSTVVAVFRAPGLIESNPVVSVVLENFGLPGFLVVKLLVFLALLAISVQGARTDDRLSYYWPPLVATVLGALLTGWNLWLLSGSEVL